MVKQMNALDESRSQNKSGVSSSYARVDFGKKTRIWENIVLQAQISVSSDFLLFKLLRLTSSCAPVIITTTTRGRCPATNIDTGRDKMFSQPKGRFSDEDRFSVFLFLVLLCYQNCRKYQLKSKEEEECLLLFYVADI